MYYFSKALVFILNDSEVFNEIKKLSEDELSFSHYVSDLVEKDLLNKLGKKVYDENKILETEVKAVTKKNNSGDEAITQIMDKLDMILSMGANPNYGNPNMGNPNMGNPSMGNMGNINNSNVYSSGYSNDYSNDHYRNPNHANPNYANPNYVNPNHVSPNYVNPSMQSSFEDSYVQQSQPSQQIDLSIEVPVRENTEVVNVESVESVQKTDTSTTTVSNKKPKTKGKKKSLFGTKGKDASAILSRMASMQK